MIDYLKDIVKHCGPFSPLHICKINGTADSTSLLALDETINIVIRANFHQPIAEFIGVFGLLDLGKLNTILNIPEYDEGAKITIRSTPRSGGVSLDGLEFENKVGDFKNFYRFVSQSVIEAKSRDLKDRQFPNASVVFSPSVQSIQRLKFQAQAHNGNELVSIQTVNDELRFNFGDISSNVGSYTAHKFTDGKSKLNHTYMWPVSYLQTALNLPGDKEISIIEIAPSALLVIKIDSGLGAYEFKFPSQGK
jgi:hypothetical protein